MAGATVRMTARKQESLQTVYNKLRSIDGAEQIAKSTQTVNDVEIWTLVYEKYFLRTGSYTSVTVVLTEFGPIQTACVVASGGGEGLANYSFGANRNFAKDCVKALESCGFQIVESDLGKQDKGLLERIFE